MVTDNFGYIGTNTTGTGAGIYAITSPNFTGDLPAGVKQIKSPSELIGVFGRTEVNVSDPQDVKKALSVQDKYQIDVMHKFYPDFKPRQVPNIDFPAYNEEMKSSPQFFSLLNFLLQFIKLSAHEQKIIDTYKSIGVEAGKSYTFYTEHPELQGAIDAGIRRGVALVDSSSRNLGKVINGWTMYPLGEYFDTNYIARTNVAKMGIYANSPFEAYYPMAFVDSAGNTLTGNNIYSIQFTANALPPVKYFWSITMYDAKTQLLSENALKRYSIGDRTRGMKFNKDGSLTLYVGNKAPKAGTSNWLPAPQGEFNVMMRLYGPKESILNGNWTPPPFLKIEN
jgi:hypothetical protein